MPEPLPGSLTVGNRIVRFLSLVQAKHKVLQSQHAALDRQRAQLEGEQGALQSTLEAKSGSADSANQSARAQASDHAGELARAHAELQAVKEENDSDLQQKASQVHAATGSLYTSQCNAHPAVASAVRMVLWPS